MLAPPASPAHAAFCRCAVIACSVLLMAGCGTEDAEPIGAPATPLDTAETVQAPGESVAGALVYVPSYSHIYHQDGSRAFNLTTTLSIRNTDPEQPIVVAGVDYYNSGGQRVRRYLEQPIELPPLGSRAYVVEERDLTGGVGANFLVAWQAEAAVSPPIVEAVMISTASTQGISFVTRGVVVRPLEEDLRP